ncbi:hypothetical protein H3S85_06255 [Bartonella sp. M0187]|uniref:hypothetical protein n=1 Tax=Bartonella apihabitans TaxID=2750929 RepID=UPI0018DEB1C7|nr:hypothetical protein [Bartonella apihabitans]MBI0026069.1 hypothetical protein [Bartonella apihabitans]
MTMRQASPTMIGHVSWTIKHAPHNYAPNNKRYARTWPLSRGEVQGTSARGVRGRQIVSRRLFRQSLLLADQDGSMAVSG